MEDIIYPLVIVKDRYNGTYSGGVYTAWNKYPWEIPRAIFLDDNTCADFWYCTREPVGFGETPEEAIEDLRKVLAYLKEMQKD